jgi:adenylate cyclase
MAQEPTIALLAAFVVGRFGGSTGGPERGSPAASAWRLVVPTIQCANVGIVSTTGAGSDLAGSAAGGRKLVAVVYADMVGYSRLIGLDDAGTLARLKALRANLIDPTIAEYGGGIVQTGGDSLLIVFDSIDGAVRCATNVQQEVPVLDGDQPPDRAIRFRIGINLGDAIADGTDLHGDAVNVAARLQAECPAGGICVSRSVRDHVHGRLGLNFEPIGELTLKNIARPVDAFVLRLDRTAEALTSDARHSTSSGSSIRSRVASFAGVGGLVLFAAVCATWWLHRSHVDILNPSGSTSIAEANPAGRTLRLPETPRLSIVVLPFENMSDDPKNDYLADAITDDLTSALSHVAGAFVIAKNSAYTYRGKGTDVRRLNSELGVRYAVTGSLRKLGDKLRISAQLNSTESGNQLWTDRFDEALDDIGAPEDNIVTRIGTTLGVTMVGIEGARSARERPTNPDEFDLILRARSLRNGPTSRLRDDQALALFEQALLLNPSSVPAMIGIASVLIDRNFSALGQWTTPDDASRAAQLVSTAQAIQPDSEDVRVVAAELLQTGGRWADLAVAARRLIELYPNRVEGYELLGMAKRFIGSVEETVGLYEKSLRLNPLESNLSNRCSCMAYALLLVGRYSESIEWFERSLAANPQAPDAVRGARYRSIATAQALIGNVRAARETMREAVRLSPYATARMWIPDNPANPQAVKQIRRLIEGLTLAGLPDHADPDADFGVASDNTLRQNLAGLTPTTAPGARTLGTTELVPFLEDQRPLVIDTLLYPWGRSVPGAIGLLNAGLGGSYSDAAQARLRAKMLALTKGDLSTRIVTVGWNSLRFDGRNLALRLVALGYGNVSWYRGGREAWEVAGLPETPVDVQDW